VARTYDHHVVGRKIALHDEVCFTTEMEAENHVIELGKHWVNNRLQGMQGVKLIPSHRKMDNETQR
jgi:hypothetical protein